MVLTSRPSHLSAYCLLNMLRNVTHYRSVLLPSSRTSPTTPPRPVTAEDVLARQRPSRRHLLAGTSPAQGSRNMPRSSIMGRAAYANEYRHAMRVPNHAAMDYSRAHTWRSLLISAPDVCCSIVLSCCLLQRPVEPCQSFPARRCRVCRRYKRCLAVADAELSGAPRDLCPLSWPTRRYNEVRPCATRQLGGGHGQQW